MPGRLSVHLRLSDRQPDRVSVSVRLNPQGAVLVEGVAVQLVDEAGESLSSRMILPISGVVSHPLASEVELRALGPIPLGARVAVAAWTEHGPVEATCPAEPCPDLHDHLLGNGLITMNAEPAPLHGLAHRERCRLGAVFRWLAPSTPCPPKIVEDTGAAADEVCTKLGIEGDQAAWVRELMAEE